MTNLNRALRAEILKLNRTLALAMIFVAPLAVNFLAWLVIMRTDIKNPEPWKSLANNTLFVWGILMMPLFTTLETALISGLDHGASAWKHLYALPIPRWTIYAAKQIIAMVLIGASMCVMCIGIWLTGTVTRTLGLKPNLDFGTPFPWSTVLLPRLVAHHLDPCVGVDALVELHHIAWRGHCRRRWSLCCRQFRSVETAISLVAFRRNILPDIAGEFHCNDFNPDRSHRRNCCRVDWDVAHFAA